MKLKYVIWAALLTPLLVTGGCSSMLSSTSVRARSSYDTGVHQLKHYPVLRATGYAVYSKQPGPTRADKMIQAMRASKLDAYRELTEQLNGLYINSETGLNNTRQGKDTVKTQVEGFVHGARVIRQYPVGDTYTTELELDTRLIYDLYHLRGAL
ncbi:MAG: hypothetical protein K6F05_02015 [Succinivibrio sp.]|nr:hypothetical protein [Succinivibrio sp.]